MHTYTAVFVTVAVVLLSHGSYQPAHATSFTVNSTIDAVDANLGDGICATAGGQCTLRAAVQETNALAGADAISVPAGLYILTISDLPNGGDATGDLNLSDDVTITGTGMSSTVIDANSLGRVFRVHLLQLPGALVTINDLTIRGGYTNGDGGGIYINGGALILNRVKVTNNTSSRGGGVASSQHELVINDSVISDNSAVDLGGPTPQGGGIWLHTPPYPYAPGGSQIRSTTIESNSSASSGGGVYVQATGSPPTPLTITNSTISGNSAGGSGGGATFKHGNVPLVIVNSTIAYNSTSNPSGGGVGATFSSDLMSVQATNSIIAHNSNSDCKAPIASLGHNLSGDNSCGLSGPGDQQSVDPLLGPLLDNGGPSPTHLLQPTSPAIDAGDAAGCPSVDQRGAARPTDGDGSGGAVCDIGAYERCAFSGSDADCDLVNDPSDNCPTVTNPSQANVVHPGTFSGDACEDPDGDDLADSLDNCPDVANASQDDLDGDAIGNPCDGDRDGDGKANGVDACPDGNPFTPVDAAGCSDFDVDQDLDGVCDPGAPSSGPSGCSGTDNCPYDANSAQDDEDGNGIGNACDYLLAGDLDGDGSPDRYETGFPLCLGVTPPDADTFDDALTNDGCPAMGTPEIACFGTVDDDGDTLVNDGCPTAGFYSEGQFKLGTNHKARCGVGAVPSQSAAWPADLISGGVPNSTDRVNLLDLTSFIAPIRRLDTNPSNPNFNMRWDLRPGPNIGGGTFIGIGDLTNLIAGTTGFPPMLGGARAFNGPACTAHPVYGD